MKNFTQNIFKWQIKTQVFISLYLLIGFIGGHVQAATINFGPNGCTLQDAIRSANDDAARGNCSAGSGADVLVSPDVWIITLNSRLPTITSDLTITTATNSGLLKIDGDDETAIMKIAGSETDVFLQRVFITKGRANNIRGAAIHIEDARVSLTDTIISFNSSTARYGGAIYVEDGELEVLQSFLEFNAIYNTQISRAEGGAIYARDSDVVINESRFFFNQAKSDRTDVNGVPTYVGKGWGASVFMDGGNLAVSHSLFAEEESALHGTETVAVIENTTVKRLIELNWEEQDGHVYFRDFSALTLNHVTIEAAMRLSNTNLNMTNSILSGECNHAETVNWVVDAGNIYLTPNPPFQGFFCPNRPNNFNYPDLLDLRNNGGRTETLALHFTSEAINAGDPSYCAPTDQRGVLRDGACDIGAYEAVEFTDLAVSAAVENSAPYVRAQEITYEVTVANNGQGLANVVRLDLDLDEVTILAIDSPYCASFPCDITGIQSQQEITMPIRLKISNDAGIIDLKAMIAPTIDSTFTDINTDNNETSFAAVVIRGADLAVELELLTRGDHFIGQAVEYEAVVRNLGFNSSNDVQFEFIPEGLNLISMDGCDSVIGQVCELGFFSNISTKTITILASISQPVFDAVGEVESSVYDINLSNNVDQLGNNGALGETDVTVSIAPLTPGPYFSNDYVQFDVEVSTGNQPASNLLLWSSFPMSDFIGCYLPINLDGFCELGSLAANSTMNVTLDYFNPITTGSAQQQFPITVFVQPGEIDLNNLDNEATYVMNVDANANLAVDLSTEATPPYFSGQQLEFEMRVVNGGPNHAVNVDIQLDTDNLVRVWEAGSLCQSTPCNLSQINRFEEENMTMVYRVLEAGDFSMTATVVSDQADLVPENNTDSFSGQAALALTDLIFRDGFQ